MMWSKIPKANGKGLRCEIEVQRRSEMVRCDRPAKRYEIQRPDVAHWIAPIRPASGYIDCCIGHLRLMANQDVRLSPVKNREQVKA